MTRPKLTPGTQIRITGAQLSTTLGSESVILDTASGRYFSLDGAGTLVWDLLQHGPATVASLEAAVTARYDVAPERCREDLETLLTELSEAALIAIDDDQGR